jgi:hypothetical protein
MVHHIERTLKVNVSADKIWQVLENYSGIENFAATIKSSPIVGDIQSGLGAKRKCTFNDGSSLVEEIIEYNQGQGYKMELSEYSYPLKNMFAEMRVKKIDANTSELFMSSDFIVKGGPLGWLMGALLMSPMMKGVFKKVMTGLAYHAATSERVDEKPLSDEQLENIITAK